MIFMVITRKELDKFRCADPNCTHDDHELYLHSRCHIDYPLRVILTNDILEIQCSMCGKLIHHIAVAFAAGDNIKLVKIKCDDPHCKEKHYILYPICHDAYMWAKYIKKTGTLELICAKCAKPVYDVLVKDE